MSERPQLYDQDLEAQSNQPTSSELIDGWAQSEIDGDAERFDVYKAAIDSHLDSAVEHDFIRPEDKKAHAKAIEAEADKRVERIRSSSSTADADPIDWGVAENYLDKQQAGLDLKEGESEQLKYIADNIKVVKSKDSGKDADSYYFEDTDLDGNHASTELSPILARGILNYNAHKNETEATQTDNISNEQMVTPNSEDIQVRSFVGEDSKPLINGPEIAKEMDKFAAEGNTERFEEAAGALWDTARLTARRLDRPEIMSVVKSVIDQGRIDVANNHAASENSQPEATSTVNETSVDNFDAKIDNFVGAINEARAKGNESDAIELESELVKLIKANNDLTDLDRLALYASLEDRTNQSESDSQPEHTATEEAEGAESVDSPEPTPAKPIKFSRIGIAMGRAFAWATKPGRAREANEKMSKKRKAVYGVGAVATVLGVAYAAHKTGLIGGGDAPKPRTVNTDKMDELKELLGKNAGGKSPNHEAINHLNDTISNRANELINAPGDVPWEKATAIYGNNATARLESVVQRLQSEGVNIRFTGEGASRVLMVNNSSDINTVMSTIAEPLAQQDAEAFFANAAG